MENEKDKINTPGSARSQPFIEVSFVIRLAEAKKNRVFDCQECPDIRLVLILELHETNAILVQLVAIHMPNFPSQHHQNIDALRHAVSRQTILATTTPTTQDATQLLAAG